MNRSRLILLTIIILAALGIKAAPRPLTPADSTVLCHGDLVFVLPADDDNPIVLSTSKGRPATDHVGIVDITPNGLHILEAIPRQGVTATPWLVFVDRATTAGDAIIAARVNTAVDADTAEAVKRARRLLGRPYDDLFMLDTQQIYCSELVQLSFLDKSGHAIFPLIPMNFTGDDGELLPYWRDRYGRLGLWVPQGAPGSNPSQIAASPLLHFID